MRTFIKRLMGRYGNAQQKFVAYPELVYGSSQLTVDPRRSLSYYETVAPVNTAVDMVSDEVASLEIILRDKGTGDFIYKHPMLDLLRTPNADTVQSELIKQLTVFFLTTGNAFLIATGPINRPALELLAVNPTVVELIEGDDGFTETIKVHGAEGQVQTFTRKEVNGRFRYFAGAEAEIWHIKSFHPGYGKGQLWGLSPLAPIAIEIEQYIEASVHNLSLLKRGARPSGAVKVNEMLTDDQYQRLQQQLERFYSGSANAGRTMILEGGDFVQMSQSNRDMDFATLKKNITETIYRSLNIPLVLVTTDASTYDNLSLSQLSLYDNSILPVINRLLDEMTSFLMSRFDKTGKYELCYDTDEITALEPRRTEQVNKLRESGVLTINEIRKQVGYDPIAGGDTIYINTNMMPIEDANIDASLEEARRLVSKES